MKQKALHVSFPSKRFFKSHWITSKLFSAALGIKWECRGTDLGFIWLALITVSVLCSRSGCLYLKSCVSSLDFFILRSGAFLTGVVGKLAWNPRKKI